MIVNKKLIQSLIRESLSRLLIEKAKFTKAENFLKDPKNQSAIFEKIKFSYYLYILKGFTNNNGIASDPTLEAEANKNIEKAFDAYLSSSPKIIDDKVWHLDKTANVYIKDLSSIPEFGNNPLYDSPALLKKIKETNNFSDQEAEENLLQRVDNFSKNVSRELISLLLKSLTHDLQRKSKTNFMEKNKDILSNLNFVHYPYAFREYSETDTSGISAILEIFGKPLEFLRGTVVNSPDELAGIGYPKGEKLRDSIGMGSELGGKIEFPYIGFLITGTITYFDEKDAQSSTYRSSYVGGHRDNNGFVRYPKDINKSMSYEVGKAYKSRQELEDYIDNFDQRFGSQTKEERKNSELKASFTKHNYGEAFIDNWTAVGMIAQWDLIVEKFKEKLTTGIAGLEMNPRKEYADIIKTERILGLSPLSKLDIFSNIENVKQNLDIVDYYAKEERNFKLGVRGSALSPGEKTELEQAKSALGGEYSFNSIPGLAKQLNISKKAVPAFIKDYFKNIKPVLDGILNGDILYHELDNNKVKQFINDHYNGNAEEDFKNFYSSVNDKIKKSGTSAKIKSITDGLKQIINDLTQFESINLKSYDNNFNEYNIKIFTAKMKSAISDIVSQLKTKQ